MNKLEQAAVEYEENGYAIIRDVVSPHLMEEVRTHVDWLINKYSELRPEHLHHPLIRDDAFWVRMIMESSLVDVGEHFLGPDIACFTAHYVCKPPVDGHAVLWHQDGAYWKLDPMQALTVWLAVDATTTENGCLRVIPGTQHLPLQKTSSRTDVPNLLFSSSDQRLVDEMIEKHGITEIELNPGDISIHHPNLLHSSEPNTSNTRRCGLDIGYISATTRILSQGVYLDPILARGNPVAGGNAYRPIPDYVEGETIPFAGCEEWNDQARRLNESSGAGSHSLSGTAPVDSAKHMVSRLQEGTTSH
ncbi:phytanoyl-CoA dioxygenase family protein [Streptomyces antnestii]|uniref:Phytanoyl-CoA dioxygenase family protein n=1 Tax=Streptomyces antnestii TaxID=2494256 RepID=A0A3S2YVW9_9ACTN|nr:phytanoyl-CoA dioxygenase family protein [Streptomyces sp. San01]RVU20484.1 phytanoyl-CoA dioxygenase family protein [Streptomyces sp. San01]